MPIACPPAAENEKTFWRTLQTFSFTRIVIAVVLLVYLSFSGTKGLSASGHAITWEICVAYLALAMVFALLTLYARGVIRLQLAVQIFFDIALITVLYLAAGGIRSGLAILYLFPLAGAAILAPLIPALFAVSVVALILLSESAYQLFDGMGAWAISSAGLYGAAFFAAVFVVNRLAAKLIRQEQLVAQRGRELHIQEAINRLVIADMDDGILVLGPGGTILAGNPSLERMVGLSLAAVGQHTRLDTVPALAPIAEAFRRYRFDGVRADEQNASYIIVKPGMGQAAGATAGARREGRRELVARVKLRFATVETAEVGEQRTVVFLQDVTEIENRAQQLKLASMGRLTASIAHEVRNPLSAISHAASLLSEEMDDRFQVRLINIVNDNAARLNRMIEDILKLSRKAQLGHELLGLEAFFTETLNDFQEAHSVPVGMIIVGEMKPYQVQFDPLHLREVVVNLLSNALRYASGGPGSIRISVVAEGGRGLELHVQDDGPPISPEVRAHLFEPFYTTSNKGTGLGLYVARELCLNNDALLDYEYRLDASAGEAETPKGRFVITFAAPESARPALQQNQRT